MGLLRQIRVKAKLPDSNWSKLERGEALPTAASALRLAGLGTIATSEHMLTGRQLRLWANTAPYLLPRVGEEPWLRAQQDWAYPLRRLGLDPQADAEADWSRGRP